MVLGPSRQGLRVALSLVGKSSQAALPLGKVRVLVSQSCLTLCDLMDCRPPGSSVHGILQAKVLEWVAIPFFRGFSQLRDKTQISCIIGRYFTVLAIALGLN